MAEAHSNVSKEAWESLKKASSEDIHLRDLMKDENRTKLQVSAEGVTLDFTRQRFTASTWETLQTLASGVPAKVKEMASGSHINSTEDRAVGHMALRAKEGDEFIVDGKDMVPEVLAVLKKIETFTNSVRSGEWVGATGKKLVNVVSIGIGGSYLGAEFVLEACRTDKECAAASQGRTLKFLANVDPIGFARATSGLDPEETLCVVISKSFRTRETMLNATLAREWIKSAMGDDAVSKHVISCSANPDLAVKFGIDENNVFGFWDWVGGRYSVCSAVGVVPLSLHFGFDQVQKFLDGCRNMDQHFLSASVEENLPITLALCGLWNSSFLNLGVRGIIPYCEALSRFAAHVQQLDMESNGKRVDLNGNLLSQPAGEIILGEPGTNAQHSFFQLVHQGREIPLELIGFYQSQVSSDNDKIQACIAENHQELMCNYFAQADALAMGKTEDEVKAEGIEGTLVQHKVFPGNRPSLLIMFDKLTPYTCGQLLALYEHRVAVEGFIWGINSFDQWGVELGKVLAKKLNAAIAAKDFSELNASTRQHLKAFTAVNLTVARS